MLERWPRLRRLLRLQQDQRTVSCIGWLLHLAGHRDSVLNLFHSRFQLFSEPTCVTRRYNLDVDASRGSEPKALDEISNMKKVACEAANRSGMEGALLSTLYFVEDDETKMMVESADELLYVLDACTGDGKDPPVFLTEVKKAPGCRKSRCCCLHLSQENESLDGSAKRSKSARSMRQRVRKTKRPKETINDASRNAAMAMFNGKEIDVKDFTTYLEDTEMSENHISRVVPQVEQLISGKGVAYRLWYVLSFAVFMFACYQMRV